VQCPTSPQNFIKISSWAYVWVILLTNIDKHDLFPFASAEVINWHQPNYWRQHENENNERCGGVVLHVVALAVADGVEAIVEQSVLGREAGYRQRAAVVLLTAAVRRDDVAVVSTVRRHIARAAPVGAGHDDATTNATTCWSWSIT